MAKLIIVVGLPGSGKTYYKNALLKTREVESVEYVHDDYHGKAIDTSEEVTKSIHYQKLIDNLKKCNTCFASDVEFCHESKLKKFIGEIVLAVGNICIEIRYFENEPEIAKKNAKLRAVKEGRKLEIETSKIEELTKIYNIPGNAKVIPIYRKTNHLLNYSPYALDK